MKIQQMIREEKDSILLDGKIALAQKVHIVPIPNVLTFKVDKLSHRSETWLGQRVRTPRRSHGPVEYSQIGYIISSSIWAPWIVQLN